MDFGCPECDGKVAPGRWMCRDCEATYLRLLRDVRPTMQALTSLTMKTSHAGARCHGGGDGFAPSPIDWGMERLRSELGEWIQTTASNLKASYGLIPLRQWKRIWTLLVANRNSLLQLPTSHDDYRRLRNIMTLIDHATHPDEGLMLAGQCPDCGTPIMCPKTAKTAKCEYCGDAHDVGTLRTAMNTKISSLHITRTPQGAADWIRQETGTKISRNMIHMRIKRGKLAAHPEGDGYYRFKISDLIALADEAQSHGGADSDGRDMEV